jgi:hypothetical protein
MIGVGVNFYHFILPQIFPLVKKTSPVMACFLKCANDAEIYFPLIFCATCEASDIS